MLQRRSGCPACPITRFSRERWFPIRPGLSQGVGWVPYHTGSGIDGGLSPSDPELPKPSIHLLLSASHLQELHLVPSLSRRCWAPAEPTLLWIKRAYLPSSFPPGLGPKLGSGPPSLAVRAYTCQVCFCRNGGGLGAMKPVLFVTLGWVLLLMSGLGATRKGSPEEASFYYGTFPPGMSIPLLVCPSVCRLVHLGWLCQGIWCFSSPTGRTWKITLCSVLK